MITTPATLFIDDDPGYLAWLADHPDGYVRNADRTPKKRYLVLHRATCRDISGTPANGRSWTTIFQKLCSPSREALDRVTEDEFGDRPSRCQHCHPDSAA